MTELITLREFQRYPFTIADTDGWSDPGRTLQFSTQTIETLSSINSGKEFFSIGYDSIVPQAFVGVIQIGDLSIQIVPKFCEETTIDTARALRNVYAMLQYIGCLPYRQADTADIATLEADFLEIFVRLFANQLLDHLCQARHVDYIQRSDELRFLRGRIRAEKHHDPARLHLIPCTFFERSGDTLIARTLRYTCNLMERRCATAETRRVLHQIRELLVDVTLTPISVQEADTIRFHRLNNGFRPFIDVCRLYLAGWAYHIQAGSRSTFTLLFPMEQVFERFVSTVLQREGSALFGALAPLVRVDDQPFVGYLALNERQRGEFGLRPDVCIRVPEADILLDTKYKRLDGSASHLGVGQGDVYQMFGYAAMTDAQAILMLYPAVGPGFRRDLTFVLPDGRTCPLFIRTIDLSGDLLSRSGWNGCLASLRGCLTPIMPGFVAYPGVPC